MTASNQTEYKRIAGIVVTYHPDDEIERRLATIVRQTDLVLVVDNSAESTVSDRLRAVCANLEISFIANDENRGLAAALNQAFEELNVRGFVWAVAFDQDSTPAAGFRDAFVAALANATELLPPAVIGANWLDEARPDFPSRHLRRHPRLALFYERVPADCDLADVTCAITSGSLFHLPAWRALGGFDEALFLDLVDTDYCLRALRTGATIRVATDARLLHRRGNKRPVRLLGHTFWPACMPPLRLQYLFRNRLRLFRRHGLGAPHWVAFELVFTVKILAEIMFLEDRKFAKLAACARGCWDGMLGRSGKIQ